MMKAGDSFQTVTQVDGKTFVDGVECDVLPCDIFPFVLLKSEKEKDVTEVEREQKISDRLGPDETGSNCGPGVE